MEENKQKLLEEKERLLSELNNLGVYDSEADNWLATPYKLSAEDATDANDVADRFEDFGERTALLEEIEVQYKAILEKLAKFDQ